MQFLLFFFINLCGFYSRAASIQENTIYHIIKSGEKSNQILIILAVLCRNVQQVTGTICAASCLGNTPPKKHSNSDEPLVTLSSI